MVEEKKAIKEKEEKHTKEEKHIKEEKEEKHTKEENHTEKIKVDKHTEESDEPNKVSQHMVFAAIVAVILIALALIFAMPHYMEEEPLTFDEQHINILEKGIDTDTMYSYNSFTFIKLDGMWYTQVFDTTSNSRYDVPLHFGPREVEDIPIYGDPGNFFNLASNNDISNYSMQAYVTFDPLGKELGFIALSNGELGINLAEVLRLALVPACTNDGDPACLVMGAEILTCDNTTAPVIYLKEDNETKVTIEDDCITIQGREYGLVKAVDRFLYKIYGVMD